MFNEPIQVVVIVENEAELKKHYETFRGMLSFLISKVTMTNNYVIIETPTHRIRMITKNPHARGVRANHVLNLTQDAEFNKYIALGMERKYNPNPSDEYSRLQFKQEYMSQWVEESEGNNEN